MFIRCSYYFICDSKETITPLFTTKNKDDQQSTVHVYILLKAYSHTHTSGWETKQGAGKRKLVTKKEVNRNETLENKLKVQGN